MHRVCCGWEKLNDGDHLEDVGIDGAIILKWGGTRQLRRNRASQRAGRSGDRIPVGGGEISRTRPDRPCGLPSLLYNGYRIFLGSKAAGAWR